MKSLAATLSLLAIATAACGGASNGAKKRDAAAAPDASADAAIRWDTGKDGSIGVLDGGASGRDGVLASDAPAMDGAARPDLPWYVPDLPNVCQVDIIPVTPASLVNLTAGPTAFLRVQGTVVWGQTVPFQPDWSWSVTRSDGQPITSKAVDGDPSQIQFPISLAGRYDITADIGSNCSGSARALVQDSVNQFRVYHLRALPPASAAAAVPYEVDVRIAAGGTSTTRDIEFDTGAPVAIDPTTGPAFPLAVAVPSYIRIQSSGSTWVTDGRSSNQGPFRTVLDLMLEYQVLVVPDPPSDGSQALPPYLLSRSTSSNVKVDAQYIGAYANPLPLPRGIAIKGHLLDPDGPAEGATISLHSYQSSTTAGQTDLLFSTVGRAASDGSYALRVNSAGNFSIVVIPPPGSPLPVATLEQVEQGISLTDASMVVPDLNFEWLSLPTTDLEIAVTLPDGTLPSEAIAVHIESLADDPLPAGVLTVGSGVDGGADSWSSQAVATVRRDASTDRDGNVAFAALPKGSYQITLAPPASLSDWGLTTYRASAKMASDALRIGLSLAPKVVVTGRLLDAKDDATTDSAEATVVATDLGHETMAAVVTAQVAADGSYALFLDSDRTYSLVAQPAAGRGLPSYVPLYGFSTGRGRMQLDDQRIPRGVLVEGHITYAGAPVAGAVVQAFCVGLAPDCEDRTNLAAGAPPAVASGISDGSGGYAIYLPDPASAE